MKIPRYGKLSARLRELGLTQNDLAYALNLSPGPVSQRMPRRRRPGISRKCTEPWNSAESAQRRCTSISPIRPQQRKEVS